MDNTLANISLKLLLLNELFHNKVIDRDIYEKAAQKIMEEKADIARKTL